jgi:drug/metabolite transporter (DMT)-like permease
MDTSGITIRGLVYTGAAMLAFAGNSIICRMALADDVIDPASFTAVRLVSGAIALLIIIGGRGNIRSICRHGSWVSALMLFVYAAAFSYAYIDLSAATGALILFGFVQGTMIVMAIIAGSRPVLLEWLGWLLAVAGLVWLMLPGVQAPSAGSAALMAAAGIAWGAYSIRGKAESDPLASTGANFLRSVAPVVLIMGLIVMASTDNLQLTRAGMLLAVLSGAVTSGVGYVIWYAALNYLTSIQAALVQLSVPAIAAAGGVMLLAEPLTVRLIAAGSLILGGICVTLIGKNRQPSSQ